MISGPANYTARQLWRIGGPMSLVYTLVVVVMVNVLFSSWWTRLFA
jgi:di/tricarboxylate transporter